MLAWWFEWNGVITLISETATMKFNTALCFALVGGAIFYRRKKVLSNVYGVLVVLIGAYTCLEWYISLPSIDTLIVHDHLSAQFQGRMSIFTATNFIGLGSAILISQNVKAKWRWAAQLFLLVVFVTSLLVLISFLLNSPLGKSISYIDTLSFETSLLFLLQTVIIFSLSEKIGIAKVFLGELEGSVVFRKMVIPVVFIPVILSYVFILLIRKHELSTSEVLVLYTVIISTVGLVTALILAYLLNVNNLKKNELIEKVDTSHLELKTYKDALDQIAMVILVDKQGIVQEVNQKFTEITGVYEEDALNNYLVKLLPSGKDDKRFFTPEWTEKYSDRIWEGERANVTRSGRKIWTQNFIIPFKNKENETHQYLIIKQDITRRKEIEIEQQEDYIKKLEQKNKELEQFTYIASHDLQEPLRTVTGLVNLLKKKYSSNFDEMGLKSMDFMTQATARMKDLIKALLDYSRIGTSLTLEKVNLNDLLSQLSNDLQQLLTENKAKLIVHDLPTLSCYKTNVSLVFQNLISNSVKFRKEGVDPVIEISARKLKNEWEFTVQDNGIGIKPEHSKKIFTIFQRLHLNNEYEGTGIGLAHCEKIVNLHRGRIWVENNGEPGSCFKFTLSTLTHLYEKES
ncbi:sensor histidine kinase [Lishizhenia tianjinensis]|nr:ATP-binding protein [Lishizhenia tianjinensis]